MAKRGRGVYRVAFVLFQPMVTDLPDPSALPDLPA